MANPGGGRGADSQQRGRSPRWRRRRRGVALCMVGSGRGVRIGTIGEGAASATSDRDDAVAGTAVAAVRKRRIMSANRLCAVVVCSLAACSHEVTSPTESLSSVSPDLVCNGPALPGGMLPASPVEVADDPKDPAASRVHWTDESTMGFDVVPADALPTGVFDVTVTNPDGKHASTLPQVLAILPPPVVSAARPMGICDAEADQKVVVTGAGGLRVEHGVRGRDRRAAAGRQRRAVDGVPGRRAAHDRRRELLARRQGRAALPGGGRGGIAGRRQCRWHADHGDGGRRHAGQHHVRGDRDQRGLVRRPAAAAQDPRPTASSTRSAATTAPSPTRSTRSRSRRSICSARSARSRSSRPACGRRARWQARSPSDATSTWSVATTAPARPRAPSAR